MSQPVSPTEKTTVSLLNVDPEDESNQQQKDIQVVESSNAANSMVIRSFSGESAGLLALEELNLRDIYIPDQTDQQQADLNAAKFSSTYSELMQSRKYKYYCDDESTVVSGTKPKTNTERNRRKKNRKKENKKLQEAQALKEKIELEEAMLQFIVKEEDKTDDAIFSISQCISFSEQQLLLCFDDKFSFGILHAVHFMAKSLHNLQTLGSRMNCKFSSLTKEERELIKHSVDIFQKAWDKLKIQIEMLCSTLNIKESYVLDEKHENYICIGHYGVSILNKYNKYFTDDTSSSLYTFLLKSEKNTSRQQITRCLHSFVEYIFCYFKQIEKFTKKESITLNLYQTINNELSTICVFTTQSLINMTRGYSLFRQLFLNQSPNQIFKNLLQSFNISNSIFMEYREAGNQWQTLYDKAEIFAESASLLNENVNKLCLIKEDSLVNEQETTIIAHAKNLSKATNAFYSDKVRVIDTIRSGLDRDQAVKNKILTNISDIHNLHKSMIDLIKAYLD